MLGSLKSEIKRTMDPPRCTQIKAVHLAGHLIIMLLWDDELKATAVLNLE